MKLSILGTCTFLVSGLLLCCMATVYGDEAQTAVELPAMGNFILPTSRQPGSFISFGQNIIGRNQVELSAFLTDFVGANNDDFDVTPFIVYGITDRFSVLFGLPIAVDEQANDSHSSGLEDSVLQFEYAFYFKKTHHFVDMATLVANVTFPTGSSTQQPPTGFGSSSFFMGATFDRTYVNWIMFTSYGGVLTTEENNTRFGDQFLYQAGIGRNIADIDKRWIFAWVLEADGEYDWHNKINGAVDPNSGGNTIFVTPSLWLSETHLILQSGVGFPVVQHLFGNQEKSNYLLAFNISWLFDI